MKRKIEMKCQGFTLIELLVVVLIIGILAAIALPQYQKAVEKARAAEAMVMLRSIADANKRYHLENGSYSALFSNLDIGIVGEPTRGCTADDRISTKYFIYGTCSCGAKGVCDEGAGTIAIAQRVPTDTNYVMIVKNDNSWWCKGYSAEGVKNCKMLGATGATNTDTLYQMSL